MVLTQHSRDSKPLPMLARFHTTMVLTQQVITKAPQNHIFKTFPYHYGSHATLPDDLYIKVEDNKFPYHYGSHATIEHQQKSVIINSGFHTTMVLTQPGCQGNKPRHCYLVSIPLWFSRNSPGKEERDESLKFPYHYGSHATCGCRICRRSPGCFHTTMVLTQPNQNPHQKPLNV